MRIHLSFPYPLDFLSVKLKVDLNSEILARGCDSPDKAFINLTAFRVVLLNEVRIYTNDSRYVSDVGCAFWILSMNFSQGYSLNPISNSFVAKAF